MTETVLSTAVPPKGESGISKTKRMPHIQALDGVRGLAIALVLIFHLLWSSPRSTGSAWMDLLLKIRSGGWVGVDLFFALSGFLITGILFDSLGSEHYFRNFYVRRVLRIFPLYYGILLILFLVFRPTWADGRQFYLLPLYLQNTPFWWNGSQSSVIKDLTGHLWSLAAEEQFYMVWPLLVFWIRDRRKLLWTALALALMAPVTRVIMLAHGATFEATYKMTICRSDSLLAGAWLALAVRGRRKDMVLRAAAPAFFLALLGYVAIVMQTRSFGWETSRPINTVGYSVLAVTGIALIGMALRPGSLTAAFMNLYPLRWLGKYSYGIYIIHMMIGSIYTTFIYEHLHSKMLFHLAVPFINLAITLPVAWLSFHFYEQPFLRLKKYFGPA